MHHASDSPCRNRASGAHTACTTAASGDAALRKTAKVPFEFFHQYPNKYTWAGKLRRQIPSCYCWAFTGLPARAENKALSHQAEPPLPGSSVSPLRCVPRHSHSGKVPPLTCTRCLCPSPRHLLPVVLPSASSCRGQEGGSGSRCVHSHGNSPFWHSRDTCQAEWHLLMGGRPPPSEC